MTDEIKQIIQEVGQIAASSAPSDDWTSVKIVRKRIATYGEFEVSFFGAWGKEPKQTGLKDKHLSAGKRTHNKLDLLRELMYKQDPALGAWYTCVMTVAEDGEFDIKFDYDNKPAWDHQPVEEEYAEDFKQFPRKAELVPQWVKPMLEKFRDKYNFVL